MKKLNKALFYTVSAAIFLASGHAAYGDALVAPTGKALARGYSLMAGQGASLTEQQFITKMSALGVDQLQAAQVYGILNSATFKSKLPQASAVSPADLAALERQFSSVSPKDIEAELLKVVDSHQSASDFLAVNASHANKASGSAAVANSDVDAAKKFLDECAADFEANSGARARTINAQFTGRNARLAKRLAAKVNRLAAATKRGACAQGATTACKAAHRTVYGLTTQGILLVSQPDGDLFSAKALGEDGGYEAEGVLVADSATGYGALFAKGNLKEVSPQVYNCAVAGAPEGAGQVQVAATN